GLHRGEQRRRRGRRDEGPDVAPDGVEVHRDPRGPAERGRLRHVGRESPPRSFSTAGIAATRSPAMSPVCPATSAARPCTKAPAAAASNGSGPPRGGPPTPPPAP